MYASFRVGSKREFFLLLDLFGCGWCCAHWGLAHYGFACSLTEYDLASEFSAGAFDDYVVFCCCHFYMNFELLLLNFDLVRVRYVFGTCSLCVGWG